MDPLTGWSVGIAVFVLGLIGTAVVVVAVLDSRFAEAMVRLGSRLIERINAVHADVVDLQEEVRFAVSPADEPEPETLVVTPKGALEELEDRVGTKLTEAQARLDGVVRRVVELEQRPVYDDGELRTAFDIEIRKARAFAASEAERLVEGLRKRTSEKFSLRDRKIEDLYGRVGVLIERADALAPTQDTVKPKPRKRVA